MLLLKEAQRLYMFELNLLEGGAEPKEPRMPDYAIESNSGGDYEKG